MKYLINKIEEDKTTCNWSALGMWNRIKVSLLIIYGREFILEFPTKVIQTYIKGKQ